MDISHHHSPAAIEAGIIKHHVTANFEKPLQHLEESYREAVWNVYQSERGEKQLADIEQCELYEQELTALEETAPESERYKELLQYCFYPYPNYPDDKRRRLDIENWRLNALISDEFLALLVVGLHDNLIKSAKALSKEQMLNVLRVGDILLKKKLDEVEGLTAKVLIAHGNGDDTDWRHIDKLHNFTNVLSSLIPLVQEHIQALERGEQFDIGKRFARGSNVFLMPDQDSQSNQKEIEEGARESESGKEVAQNTVEISKEESEPEVQNNLPKQTADTNDTPTNPSALTRSTVLSELYVKQREAIKCAFIVLERLSLLDQRVDAAKLLATRFTFAGKPEPKYQNILKELNKCVNKEIDVTKFPANSERIIKIITPVLMELKGNLGRVPEN